MDIGFPAERTHFSRCPQIGAAISGPRIADTNFTDMRIFLHFWSFQNQFRISFGEEGMCVCLLICLDPSGPDPVGTPHPAPELDPPPTWFGPNSELKSPFFRTRSTTTRDRNLQFRGAVSTGGSPLDFLFFLQCLCAI